VPGARDLAAATGDLIEFFAQLGDEARMTSALRENPRMQDRCWNEAAWALNVTLGM